MKKAENMIWDYLSKQFDDFGLLPTFDEVMLALEGQLHVDDLPLIHDVTQSFIKLHDMKGVVVNG